MGGKLAGKVAVVTGASSGIGWASALALAGEGAHMVVTARRRDRLDALAALIEGADGRCAVVEGDLGVICPGGVKTEFAFGTGRTPEAVASSAMLEAEDVADAVLLACTQRPRARIIEIQMPTMAEPL